MNFEMFTITENDSLRAALRRIEANHHGVIFGINPTGAVIGLATDGDIRRKLLDGASLDDPINCCLNTEFVWADTTTSRELLLKQLDHRIRVIPLLDASRRLVEVVSRDRMPILVEEPVYARARSPVRVSFGGGGSDLTHFFSDYGGAVINSTLSLYSHATMRRRNDLQIMIQSRDLGETLEAAGLDEALRYEGRFGLIQALLKTVHPDFGFDLYLHSDFPMKSGLGGSAVVSASVLGCFNQFRRDQWDLHELAELAFQAERLHLGIAGGWQDQYATVFGGFNFMEFKMEQNIVHPLRVHPDTMIELEESLVLCDTGTIHDSGVVHQDQRQHMGKDDVRAKVRANVELTYQMRDLLLRGRLLQFGKLMHEAWQLKRHFSDKISNEKLDHFYDQAIRHGAAGGKLMGAGGGGFFVFYSPPFCKHELIQALEDAGGMIRPFTFDQKGLHAWTVRECRNHIEESI